MQKDQARTTARELQLERSFSKPVFLHGPTMRPLLRDGDYVEVVTVSLDEIEVGDIVTIREADRFPTRRVVEIDPDARTLSVQADYTPAAILEVSADDLLGRVVARTRAGRRIQDSSLRWRLATWWAPVQKRLLWRWRHHIRRRRTAGSSAGSGPPRSG